MCRSAMKGRRLTRIIQASASAPLHARDKLRNGFGANATAFTASERSLGRVEFNQQLSAPSLTLLPQAECFAGGVFGRRKATAGNPLADEGFLFRRSENAYFHGLDCGPASLHCQGPCPCAWQGKEKRSPPSVFGWAFPHRLPSFWSSLFNRASPLAADPLAARE